MSELGVQFGDIFVPQAEVLRRAAQAATGFRGLGINREDRAALMLRNDIAFLEATAGIRIAGGLPVPINWHLKAEELSYILHDSGAKSLVIHSDLLRNLHTAIPKHVRVLEVKPAPVLTECFGVDVTSLTGLAGAEDWESWRNAQTPWDRPPDSETASMIYTSGTTGRPKGVRRVSATPEQYQQTLEVVGGVLGVRPNISTVIPAPLYHSAPNAFAVYSLQMGTHMVIMPRFDAEELLRVIEEHKVTRFQAVPTMFVRLLQLPREVREKYDTSSLEYVVHAAAPCPIEVKQAMIDWWGPIIWEYYGSTEISAVTLCSPEDAIKYPGTVGRPLPQATVKVLDENGAECPPGKPGSIHGRLHCVTEFTYQNDPEKRNKIERDGLITAGDIGYFNEDGCLFLCDRANDMIISGGVNIYPAEIESVLINCPGVRDCAVFGVPHPDFGESVMAIVEPQAGAAPTVEAVREFLSERIADYKVPRVIEFRDGLPREDSGKLFKRKLREPYWQKSGRNI